MVGDDFDQNIIETVQTAYNDFLYPIMDWCVVWCGVVVCVYDFLSFNGLVCV